MGIGALDLGDQDRSQGPPSSEFVYWSLILPLLHPVPTIAQLGALNIMIDLIGFPQAENGVCIDKYSSFAKEREV